MPVNGDPACVLFVCSRRISYFFVTILLILTNIPVLDHITIQAYNGIDTTYGRVSQNCPILYDSAHCTTVSEINFTSLWTQKTYYRPPRVCCDARMRHWTDSGNGLTPNIGHQTIMWTNDDLLSIETNQSHLSINISVLDHENALETAACIISACYLGIDAL